jgi:hypothetical protein
MNGHLYHAQQMRQQCQRAVKTVEALRPFSISQLCSAETMHAVFSSTQGAASKIHKPDGPKRPSMQAKNGKPTFVPLAAFY